MFLFFFRFDSSYYLHELRQRIAIAGENVAEKTRIFVYSARPVQAPFVSSAAMVTFLPPRAKLVVRAQLRRTSNRIPHPSSNLYSSNAHLSLHRTFLILSFSLYYQLAAASGVVEEETQCSARSRTLSMMSWVGDLFLGFELRDSLSAGELVGQQRAA